MDPLRPVTNYQSENRVVEIVDCLSETLVSVSHLDKEKPQGRGKILLAAAAICFFVFGLSFFQAVSTASSNKQALHKHLAEGKPSHSFRPARVANSHEVIGGMALFGGLALSLTFLATRSKTRSAFRAESPAADAEPSFEMVKMSGPGAQVRVHPEMTLRYTDAEGELSDDDLCQRGMAFPDAEGWLTMNLPDHGKLSMTQGHRAYYVSWTPRPLSGAIAASQGFDSRFAAYIGAAAGAALLFLALLEALPIDESTLYGDRFPPSERYIAIQTTAMEDAIVEPEEGDTGASGDTALAEASEAGAAGTSGIESATTERASMAIQNRANQPQMSREQHLSVAAHSGIMGVMASRQIFANSNALDSYASGDAVQDWMGGFEGGPAGHQAGELSGSWGNGVNGFGLYGTVKVGNKLPGLHYGDGNEPCTSTMPCTGHGGGPMTRVSKAPVFKIGDMESSGGLDRAIIRRHIKRQKLRITHCYEKRLLVSPDLSGTLTARFSIGNNGKVIGSQASGMGDSDLQQCVAEVVGSIQFPSTSGGALVNVSYPFTFQPAGS